MVNRVTLWDEDPAELKAQIAELEERAIALELKAMDRRLHGDAAAAEGCIAWAEAAEDEASKLRNRLWEVETDLAFAEAEQDRAYGRMGC